MALSSTDTMAGASSRSRRGSKGRGTGFLVEALFVLAILMACVAVFVRLFSAAQLEGVRANRTSEAVIAATNCAEEFCADPTSTSLSRSQDGFEITCEVTPFARESGTYYEAHIEVRSDGEVAFELDTSRYVSDGDAS